MNNMMRCVAGTCYVYLQLRVGVAIRRCGGGIVTQVVFTVLYSYTHLSSSLALVVPRKVDNCVLVQSSCN